MKVINISPSSPYNEGWSYQENILPYYQKKLGNEVMLIISNLEHRNGKQIEVNCTDNITCDGFRVIRKKKHSASSIFLRPFVKEIDVYEDLIREKPDFIFYHGMVSSTIFQIVKYKKNVDPSCVIVQDNHMDYNIGFDPTTIKGKMQKILYSSIYKLTSKYIDKVYGVTPWRAQYAHEVFGVAESKIDVLIMGANDEEIDTAKKEGRYLNIRSDLKIPENDFLVVTGGKIDEKKKIHLLMETINQIDGASLIVFGSIASDIKDSFEKQLSDKVKWVGFIPSEEAYTYFLAADLVVFPGQHSVLWEQACACKVPCVFGKWEGMEHVNNGGNSKFVDEVTVDNLKQTILDLMWTPEYDAMKKTAESECTDIYLYSKIARKSLEMARKA